MTRKVLLWYFQSELTYMIEKVKNNVFIKYGFEGKQKDLVKMLFIPISQATANLSNNTVAYECEYTLHTSVANKYLSGQNENLLFGSR